MRPEHEGILAAMGLKAQLEAVEAERDRLKEDNDDLNRLFEMEHKRDIEAVQRWRKQGKDRDLTLPDRGTLLDFMADERDRLRAALEAVTWASGRTPEEMLVNAKDIARRALAKEGE